jgi:aldose 1-epimerase
VEIASRDGGTVAEFVPEAAMLCCSLSVDGEQLLDSGHGVEAYAERGKTMGVPLLYPWANRLAEFAYSAGGKEVQLPDDRSRLPADPNGLPIHGLIPNLMRFEAGAREDGVLAGGLNWSTPELLELFPYAHEVSLEARVDNGRLTIATTVEASGQDRMPISFGFHPYLRLPGRRESCRLTFPPAEHLILDDRMLPSGATEPAPEGELELADQVFDDAFKPHRQPARYAVAAAGREIALELREGFPYSQVYAPEGKDFICFEPMTAPANALRTAEGLTLLEPGDTYRAVFSVTSSSA